MNKHHRDEIDMKHQGRHRETHKSRKKMSGGGKMVGEKTSKTSGYDHADWSSVQSMLTGKHPTTHLATVKCGGNRAEHMAAGGVEGRRKKMAAGGVGKIRHEAYD
jgi:hypothetical protein